MKKNEKLAKIFLVFALVLNISILVSGITPVKLSDAGAISAQQQFNPVELAQIDTGGGMAYDIQVVDDIAYVADGQLVLVDVSDPENPQIISSYHDGAGAVEEICIIDDLAFIADGPDGLEIIDVSDPENPVEVGSFNDGGYARGVSVSGGHAFVADGLEGLEVIDVNDPENPAEIAQYDLPESYMSIFLADSIAFIPYGVVVDGLIQHSDLRILSVTDVNNIVEISSFDAISDTIYTDCFISGNLGFFSVHGRYMGIRILNISDLSNPREIGRYSTGTGAPNKMTVKDGLVYVASGDSGLSIVDISEPTYPIEIASYYDGGGYAYDVQVIDNLAFVADRHDGLEIIQLYDNGEDSSASQGTRNTAIPGFELATALFVLLSCFCLKKGKKGDPIEE